MINNEDLKRALEVTMNIAPVIEDILKILISKNTSIYEFKGWKVEEKDGDLIIITFFEAGDTWESWSECEEFPAYVLLSDNPIQEALTLKAIRDIEKKESDKKWKADQKAKADAKDRKEYERLKSIYEGSG